MNSRAGLSITGSRTAPIIERVSAMLNTRLAWWSAFAGICALLLVPLFLVDVPPLLDYPNHLARMYVLAFGEHDPILSRMYQQHWAIIPNLAIDLVMPEMLKILPIHVAGRIVLGVTLLLPLFGVIAYHRALFGIRSYWPLAGALMAYNALFIMGFMNFLISLGMALLVAAAWQRWRSCHPVAVALCGAIATTTIFFMHLFGLVFLAALLGAEELAWAWQHRSDRPALLGRLAHHGLIALTAFLPPVVLYTLAPLSNATGQVIWLPWSQKFILLFEPFLAYDQGVDRVAGFVFLAALYLAARQRRLRAAPGITFALAVLFAAFLSVPFAMMESSFLDARFPIMLGLLLFAGLRPVALSHRARITIAAALALIFVARTASLSAVWYAHNSDVSDMRRVISFVPPGAKVLVVSVDQDEAPNYWAQVPRGRRLPGFNRLDFHLPALLTIERRAFWPYLFTTAKQPLAVRPPFDRISLPQGMAPSFHELEGPPAPDLYRLPYLIDWERHFDYVLLLNSGAAGDLTRYIPDHLRLLARTDIAAVFRIRPSAPLP